MLTNLSILSSAGLNILDATGSIYGMITVGIFIVAYITVVAEEFLHLRKSKPVILAASIMWAVISIYISTSAATSEVQQAHLHDMEKYLSSTLVEYGEL